MKLKGKVLGKSFSDRGNPIINVEVARVGDYKDVDLLNEEYHDITIKKSKGRSLEQNSMMWGVIAQIDKYLNGYPTEDGRWDIYLYGLEMAGVEYEDYSIPPEAVKILKESFRKCRVIDEDGDHVIIRCYTGSSKLNKGQMADLITFFINWAFKMGLRIDDEAVAI